MNLRSLWATVLTAVLLLCAALPMGAALCAPCCAQPHMAHASGSMPGMAAGHGMANQPAQSVCCQPQAHVTTECPSSVCSPVAAEAAAEAAAKPVQLAFAPAIQALGLDWRHLSWSASRSARLHPETPPHLSPPPDPLSMAMRL